MIKLRICLCLCTAIAAWQVSAQELTRIGVPLFDFKEDNALHLDNHVTEVVIDLLQKSGRYRVVDMTSEEQRQKALDRASENYKADNWLDAHRALNAEIILGGEITSIKFVKSNSSTQPGYRAAITMTLKLIDVESSEIKASEHFISTKSELRLTPETALSAAINSISPDILRFFREHVKQQFAVVKINEIKRDRVTSVTVRIPEALGISRGDKFGLVYYEELVDGAVIPTPIGGISIDQYVSQDYWIATVKKGGDRLYALKEQLESIRCTE